LQSATGNRTRSPSPVRRRGAGAGCGGAGGGSAWTAAAAGDRVVAARPGGRTGRRRGAVSIRRGALHRMRRVDASAVWALGGAVAHGGPPVHAIARVGIRVDPVAGIRTGVRARGARTLVAPWRRLQLAAAAGRPLRARTAGRSSSGFGARD